MLTRWKFVVFVGAAVVLVTSIPQLSMIIRRGADWQGSYALIDYDELSYSAYLHSLIEGRPRRNNPYSVNEHANSENAENYFSIQSLPAYSIALPARVLGVSASTAFIFLLPLMAFGSSLAIFWLLTEMTGNERVAALGVLVVLLCGRLVSESPFVTTQTYGAFAFLRRYIPAVSFPLFFLFCVFVWRAFTDKPKPARAWSVAAGGVFGLLVFSYFYLWTAAAAWLICFTAVWLIARPEDRRHVVVTVSILTFISFVALAPYFYLLSLRIKTTDTTQALVFTHAPDLFRVTEVTGALILLALAVYARRRALDWRTPQVLFAASCAAAPFIVFNQQILTGRSLQAFHYEQFIINYVVLVGLVTTYQLIWRHLKIRPVVWVVFALTIGLATALKEARDNSALNDRRDQAKPVFERLDHLAARSGYQGLALFNNSLLAASALTSSSVPELWAPNLSFFGSTSVDEQVERFYQYLFYLGVDPQMFEKDLHGSAQVRAAVFGLHRANSGLTQTFMPVSADEIRAQVQSYSSYINGFSRQHASRWPLSCVVMIDESPYNLANLDRWYVRDSGERVGGSVIYTVRLRTEK